MKFDHIHEEISRVGARFSVDEPFLGAFFSSVNKAVSNHYPGIFIEKDGTGFRLAVNPVSWNNEMVVINNPTDTIFLRIKAFKKQLYHIIFKDFLFNDHSQFPSWKDFKILTSSEKKIIGNKIDRMLLTASHFAGESALTNIHPGIASMLARLNQPGPGYVQWKRLLRIFIRNSGQTKLKNTIRKPSSRYGTTPGIKIDRNHHLMVVVDTSGSVSKKELESFFGEIHRIWKRGAKIFVQEVDDRIRQQYDYKGSLPQKVTGRGQTDFNPPIVYANTVLRPDGIIYFTDGLAQPPKVKSRSPLLWVITKNGINRDEREWHDLPALKIKLEQ